MYFLVQSNIYSDPDRDRIFDALEALNLEYEKIEVNSNTQIIQIQQDRKDVFVYGSVKLARLAAKNTDWYPGSFYGGNHLYQVYSQYYTHHLLNFDTEVFEFGEQISWHKNEEKFIKPYDTAKLFTGKIFTESEWNEFIEESLISPRTPLLTAESRMQASVPKYIIKEARVWIVGGQIAASVYYKFQGDISFESEVSVDGIEFAKEMIALFSVADAFVMDICLTFDGWKIVEINCINSAGFYPNLKVKHLLKALNLFFSN